MSFRIILILWCFFVGSVSADPILKSSQESVSQFVERFAPNVASKVVHVATANVWDLKTPVIISFYEYPITYADKSKNYGDSPNESEILGVIYVPINSTEYRKFEIDGYGPEGANAEINSVFFARTDRTSDKKLFVMVSWHNNNGILYSTYIYDKPQIKSGEGKLVYLKKLSQLFGMECDHCPSSEHPNRPARYKNAADVKAELNRIIK